MFFKQFYLEGLGHASYLVGSEDTGDALVLDPQRNVGGYFEAARSQGMRIRYGIDTHGHNDYLSGLAELAARTKLTLLGSVKPQNFANWREGRSGRRGEVAAGKER